MSIRVFFTMCATTTNTSLQLYLSYGDHKDVDSIFFFQWVVDFEEYSDDSSR